MHDPKTTFAVEAAQRAYVDLKHRVEAVTAVSLDAIEAAPLAQACEHWMLLKELHGAIDHVKRELGAHVTKLGGQVLPEMFKAAEVDSIKVPSLKRSFSPNQRVSASMVDKPAAMEWLAENGAEHLITRTVNANSLAAFCKEMLVEHGKDIPEDKINMRTYYTMGSTKYTPKEGI